MKNLKKMKMLKMLRKKINNILNPDTEPPSKDQRIRNANKVLDEMELPRLKKEDL